MSLRLACGASHNAMTHSAVSHSRGNRYPEELDSCWSLPRTSMRGRNDIIHIRRVAPEKSDIGKSLFISRLFLVQNFILTH